jgi:xanthine/uracil/vitamin C permease (AzgA family)
VQVLVTGFSLSCAFSSVIAGLVSNLPVPVGGGIGCAAFYAYSLARQLDPVQRNPHATRPPDRSDQPRARMACHTAL